MPDEELSELEQRIADGPPKDWNPDWRRWVILTTTAKKHAAMVTEQQARLTTLESELAKAKEAHQTEVGQWRTKHEEAEIKSIPGLVEPDLALFRQRYQAETESLPENKRPTLADWTKKIVEAPPRWAAGFVDKSSVQDERPPSDTGRKAPPPPKGGYTEEAIAAMTPAEFKAHEAAITAQLNSQAG